MLRGEPRWTIAELSERVAAALAEAAYEPPANGQVRAVPDLRTIRYYTSLGLLDRPSAMKGRTALYGRRHLLQLVAVKRLQAEGRSLSEVQAALTGLDDERLAAIARVPEMAAPHGDPAPADLAPRRAGRFWAAPPAEPLADSITESPADSIAESPAESPDSPADSIDAEVEMAPLVETAAGAPAARRAVTMMAKVDLAPGVSLVIDGAALPDPTLTHAAIASIDLARAAAPLLEALRRHGLVREATEEEERE
jgi:DNA-binding transcriptional MerR regulator